MPKLTEEQVMSLLNKAIDGDTGAGNVSDAVNADINKDIAEIKKSISALTSFIAKNVKVETPKTVDEIVSEKLTAFKDELIKSIKPPEQPKAEDQPIAAMTQKQLTELIAKQVTDSMSKMVKKSGEPEGEISSAEEIIDEVIDNLTKSSDSIEDDDTDDDDEEPAAAPKRKVKKEADPLEITAEASSPTGRMYTAKEIQKHQKLDDFIGGKLQVEFAKRGIGSNTDKDDE